MLKQARFLQHGKARVTKLRLALVFTEVGESFFLTNHKAYCSKNQSYTGMLSTLLKIARCMCFENLTVFLNIS